MITEEQGTELPYRFSAEFSDIDDYERVMVWLRDEMGKELVRTEVKRAGR